MPLCCASYADKMAAATASGVIALAGMRNGTFSQNGVATAPGRTTEVERDEREPGHLQPPSTCQMNRIEAAHTELFADLGRSLADDLVDGNQRELVEVARALPAHMRKVGGFDEPCQVAPNLDQRDPVRC